MAEANSGTGIEVRISCSLFNVWCEHVKNAAEHSLASIEASFFMYRAHAARQATAVRCIETQGTLFTEALLASGMNIDNRFAFHVRLL